MKKVDKMLVNDNFRSFYLNIRAGPTFAVLLWTVPPIYN